MKDDTLHNFAFFVRKGRVDVTVTVTAIVSVSGSVSDSDGSWNVTLDFTHCLTEWVQNQKTFAYTVLKETREVWNTSFVDLTDAAMLFAKFYILNCIFWKNYVILKVTRSVFTTSFWIKPIPKTSEMDVMGKVIFLFGSTVNSPFESDTWKWFNRRIYCRCGVTKYKNMVAYTRRP